MRVFLLIGVAFAGDVVVRAPDGLSAASLTFEAMTTELWGGSMVAAPERPTVLFQAACTGGDRIACAAERRWMRDPGWENLRNIGIVQCVWGDRHSCRTRFLVQCAGAGHAGRCESTFRHWCEQGDEEFCAVSAGYRFRQGDTEGALALGGEACAHGVGFGCAWQVLAAERKALPNRAPDAVELAARGCELGNPYSCWLAAGEASLRESNGQDVRVGDEYLQKACAWGLLNACDAHASALIQAGSPDDAQALLAALCEQYAYAPACAEKIQK
jgi:hypothetical protein